MFAQKNCFAHAWLIVTVITLKLKCLSLFFQILSKSQLWLSKSTLWLARPPTLTTWPCSTRDGQPGYDEKNKANNFWWKNLWRNKSNSNYKRNKKFEAHKLIARSSAGRDWDSFCHCQRVWASEPRKNPIVLSHDRSVPYYLMSEALMKK